MGNCCMIGSALVNGSVLIGVLRVLRIFVALVFRRLDSFSGEALNRLLLCFVLVLATRLREMRPPAITKDDVSNLESSDIGLEVKRRKV